MTTTSVIKLNDTTYYILLHRSKTVSIRLDSDIVDQYDKLVLKLNLKGVDVTRTSLIRRILVEVLRRPELLEEILGRRIF
jgi:hypothetical protein